jgi:hypothetical protein
MRELQLIAVSDDGTHLILRPDGDDVPMALPVDERLHAAMRGDRARLGQLEIQMDSQVRPRDIQARIPGYFATPGRFWPNASMWPDGHAAPLCAG